MKKHEHLSVLTEIKQTDTWCKRNALGNRSCLPKALKLLGKPVRRKPKGWPCRIRRLRLRMDWVTIASRQMSRPSHAAKKTQMKESGRRRLPMAESIKNDDHQSNRGTDDRGVCNCRHRQKVALPRNAHHLYSPSPIAGLG